jgi:hypothetical protein
MGGGETDFFEPFAENEFKTYEGEQKGEACLEKTEKVDDIEQEEKQGTQAEDGKDVGEINNIGVAGDRKNGGDGIGSENDIGKFNDQNHYKQRGEKEFAVFAFDEKTVADVFGIDPEIF